MNEIKAQAQVFLADSCVPCDDVKAQGPLKDTLEFGDASVLDGVTEHPDLKVYDVMTDEGAEAILAAGLRDVPSILITYGDKRQKCLLFVEDGKVRMDCKPVKS